MLDWDRPSQLKGEFRFAALQSEVGKALLRRGGRAENDISSIVLATAGAHWSHHLKIKRTML
jgi:predicted DCC family thiol-disulfide oxidoreductase YuxK